MDDSSRALFRGGRDALRDRRYGRAVELLERWVKLHGKKPSKRSALDDAYVYIGEALKGQKKPKRAIQSFQKVYKMGAPKADMWTKAVFRMGECFEMLGDKRAHADLYKMASSKGSGGFAKKRPSASSDCGEPSAPSVHRDRSDRAPNHPTATAPIVTSKRSSRRRSAGLASVLKSGRAIRSS